MKKLGLKLGLGLGLLLSIGSTSLWAGLNPSAIEGRNPMLYPSQIKYTLRHDKNQCELTDGKLQLFIVYEYNLEEWKLINSLNIYKNDNYLPKGTYIETYSESYGKYNHYFSNMKECNDFRIRYNKLMK